MGTPLKIAMFQWGNPISRLSTWDLAAKWACTPYEFAAIYTLHVIKKIALPIQSYFFSTCEPSILNHYTYTYIIYISTVLNVLTPSLCARSSLLLGSADIQYKSVSSGLLTEIFVTQNVDLLRRRVEWRSELPVEASTNASTGRGCGNSGVLQMAKMATRRLESDGRLLIAELNEETSNHITKKNHQFPNMLMGFL